MNKLFSKIIGASLAIAMMIGVGAGVNAFKEAKEVNAVGSSATLTAYNALEDGCYYMITDGAGHYLKPMAFASKGSASANGSYSYSNGTITIGNSSALTSDAWYFENSEDGWIIKDSSSESANTLYFINDNNGVACGSTSAAFTANDGGSSKIKFTANDTSGNNRYLSYASGNYRCYKTGSTGTYNLSIYKIVEEAAKTPVSLALSGTYPTQFYQGDTFSHEGLVATVTYNDDTTANVTTSVTFTGYSMSQIGEQTVTVSYTENNTTVNTTYTINVRVPRTMTSIELHGTIAKTEYYVGDSWDLEGLDIQVNWSEGDPTFVDLDDNAVVYECNPATATSTSVESFDIEVMYSDFDEVFTVDGLTVVEHPLIDVLNKTTIPNAAIGSNTSSWGVWTEVTDFTYSASNSNGAKYQVKLMGPGSNSYVGRMNDSTNGGFYTSKAPVGVRIKTIAFSSIAESKDVSVYLSNEAYGSLPATTDYKATLTSTNLSYTVEGTYSCFAIRGRSSSLDVGALTIEYEEINPLISASPSSITLSSNGTQNVEITVENYTSIPSLECVVQSGATSIESATVGAINNLTYKATATITASNVPGNAVVRVRDVTNPDLYYVDINVAVQSAKEVIENTVTTSSSLAYRYNKSGANTDTLNKDFINLEDDNYANWTGKTGTSGAVYAGNTYGPAENIQIRSNNNNSGIVTTSSGGLAKKITVVWNSGTQNGRTLDVFGKNSAYEAATDLYDGTKKGTKLGSIVKGTDTSLTIAGDYEFIGLRSNTGAMNIESINIQWGEYSYTYSDISMRFGGSIDEDLWNELDSNENPIAGVGVLITGYEEHLRTPYSIKEHYNEAVQLNEVTDIEAQVANCYVSLSTFNIPQKNNCYYWNLKYAIASIDDMLDSYTATAYIKLTNGELVFLKQVKYSVWSLAKDYLDNRNCDEETSDGSLYNIVESAGLE